MEIDNIQDVVARDTWESIGHDGKTTTHDILVGRPFPVPNDPNHDWVCPVLIQHFTDRIVPAYGAGPVDALMNGMVLVKAFFDKIHKGDKPTRV